MLIAALSSGLNDRVTDIALADIRAALGISYDRGSWLIAGYQAAEVAAMMIAPGSPLRSPCADSRLPWRSASAGRGAAAFVTHYPLFLALRVLQGIFGGALPPLLMTVALRFCRRRLSFTA